MYAKTFLVPLVERNYRLREQGLRPDRLHWADAKLMELGYWDLIPDA
jgi:hypothetical protein